MTDEWWLDLSNYGGIFTLGGELPHRALSAARPKANFAPAFLTPPMLVQGAAQQMKDQGVAGVVIGTQDYDIAMAQTEAVLKVGLGLAHYVYLLFLQEFTAQMDAAMRVAATPESRWLGLDCEDPNAEKLTEGATVDFIQNCADYCIGKKNSKIYTGPYWWQRQTGNTDQFSRAGFDVWNATARGTPGRAAVTFGGWTIPFGDQWQFDHTVGGVNVDMNTFAGATPTPTPQPSELAQASVRLNAVAADITRLAGVAS